MTPLELTNAYATLASGGWYAPPTLILQVRDSQGRRLLDNTPRPQPELQSKAVAQLNQMMQAVVTSGTGRSAQLNRPAAGKTGTTSAERDIWFVGYTLELVASVWLGNDDNSKIGGGATGVKSQHRSGVNLCKKPWKISLPSFSKAIRTSA
ncbi:penicillin-binding transpeptidase domain-containing protein [Synechococcus elongatus]|uniref:penicillin-binding transpeptidase domain-containing protein n=1 Tax=Synechococcus elongatus TaxID=32046 RepID=UPI0030D5DC14